MDKSFSKVVDQILTPFPTHCAGAAGALLTPPDSVVAAPGSPAAPTAQGTASCSRTAEHIPLLTHQEFCISPTAVPGWGSPRHGHTLM